MFRWLLPKKMSGGLVFGPPAWMPERIEATFDFKGKPAATEVEGGALTPTFLAQRSAQISFLERIGIGRTAAVIPSLLDQLTADTASSDHLVLNLLPLQPEYAMGAALSRLALDDLAAGLNALSNVARRIWIVCDRHDHRLRRLWKQQLRGMRNTSGTKRSYCLRPLLNRYPQGDPTILMRTLFRKRLGVGEMPTKLGVLLVDPVSCWAIGRWLRTGQTFTDRPVQLFAQGSAPRLVLGRIGETLQEFCIRHQVDAANQQVIVNGMLSGREAAPLDARIESHTEAITLRPSPDMERASACLACGWCVDVCPTALRPIHLLQLAQARAEGEEPTRAERESLHCIGCGLCSYVCPTRLPLMHETLRLREVVLADAAASAGAAR